MILRKALSQLKQDVVLNLNLKITVMKNHAVNLQVVKQKKIIASCCSEEINYYRLSEWFTSIDSQKKQIIPLKNILLSTSINASAKDELENIIFESYHDPGPIIKIPKYRLHSQTKLDPPINLIPISDFLY